MTLPLIRNRGAREQAVPARNRGFALITALLMLVVLTLLGVSLMGGVSLHAKMASNTQEKMRATTAASLALNAVESVLQSQPLIPQSCAANSTNAWRVCNAGTLTTSNQVLNSTWGLSSGSASTYGTPVTSLSGTGYATAFQNLISQTGGKDTYYSVPQFVVEYEGHGKLPPGYSLAVNNYKSGSAPVNDVYRITAMGTGGNSSAVSILQSIYFYMHAQ